MTWVAMSSVGLVGNEVVACAASELRHSWLIDSSCCFPFGWAMAIRGISDRGGEIIATSDCPGWFLLSLWLLCGS